MDLPTIVLRGVPKAMPGFFVPRCDEDGFFMSKQCNPKKECWCVDRNGAELMGSRKVKGEDPKCSGLFSYSSLAFPEVDAEVLMFLKAY